ncbi:MAG: hypothetical protein WBG86_21395 [Polyangiales bacterium]
MHQCEVDRGPDGDGSIDEQIITEYACERRTYYEFTENAIIELVIDTTSGDIVGGRFEDDSGVCTVDGFTLSAGDTDLSGCRVISILRCEGKCGDSESTLTECESDGCTCVECGPDGCISVDVDDQPCSHGDSSGRCITGCCRLDDGERICEEGS